MKNIVVLSLNDISGMFCVDIIRNDEGKFSFKSFRRDFEANSGWYSFGPESEFIYSSVEEAKMKAGELVKWII